VLAGVLLIPAATSQRAGVVRHSHRARRRPPRAYVVPPRPGPEYVWVEGYKLPRRGGRLRVAQRLLDAAAVCRRVLGRAVTTTVDGTTLDGGEGFARRHRARSSLGPPRGAGFPPGRVEGINQRMPDGGSSSSGVRARHIGVARKAFARRRATSGSACSRRRWTPGLFVSSPKARRVHHG